MLEWVKNGTPAEEIKKVVELEGIDLVIMPAHPEKRLEHFLLSRTNDAVIRSLPASLLLVKDFRPLNQILIMRTAGSIQNGNTDTFKNCPERAAYTSPGRKAPGTVNIKNQP